jgi:hypothetical protein
MKPLMSGLASFLQNLNAMRRVSFEMCKRRRGLMMAANLRVKTEREKSPTIRRDHDNIEGNFIWKKFLNYERH